jgi:hypothetical protein
MVRKRGRGEDVYTCLRRLVVLQYDATSLGLKSPYTAGMVACIEYLIDCGGRGKWTSRVSQRAVFNILTYSSTYMFEDARKG